MEKKGKDIELAALLEEVRALRHDIAAIKKIQGITHTVDLEPEYEVLVKPGAKKSVAYEVAVKARPRDMADYEAADSATLPYSPYYEVLVKAFTPDYQVLAYPAYPPDYQVMTRTTPKLPPDYAVAVKPVFEPGTDLPAVHRNLPPDYQVLVKPEATLSPHYEVIARAFLPDYGVLVKPAYPADYQVAVKTIPALPPDYGVAVRGPGIGFQEKSKPTPEVKKKK